jgi:hypothetical protein
VLALADALGVGVGTFAPAKPTKKATPAKGRRKKA